MHILKLNAKLENQIIPYAKLPNSRFSLSQYENLPTSTYLAVRDDSWQPLDWHVILMTWLCDVARDSATVHAPAL